FSCCRRALLRLAGLNSCRARAALSHGCVVAWVVTACASCGRADDAQPDSGARSIQPDGGSTPSNDEGPAPQMTRARGAMRWARGGYTGACSPYEDTVERPVNLRVFPTEAECERSCHCSQLECVCNGIECPSTIDEATQTLCAVANTDDEP